MGVIIGLIIVVVAIIYFALKQDGPDEADSRTEEGMGDFKIRAIPSSKKVSDYTFEFLEVQVRGLIPVPQSQVDCSIYTHIFDITDQSHRPIMSALEGYSEPNSKTYQYITELGPVPFESGYKSWVTVSRIILDYIVLPYSGNRNILIQVCVVPTNNPPKSNLGFREGNTDQIYAISKTTTNYQTEEIGYLESANNRREVEEIIIELGFHIAASDGQLSPEEGTVIKEWASDILASSNLDNNENEKQRLNKAITTSFERANNGQIDSDNLVNRLNDIATVQEKYEAIELCLDVMKADSIADENELNQIDIIAKKMEIDPDRFRALQDRRLAEVKHIDTTQRSIEQILGITPKMSKEDIRKHLAREYTKWNSRVLSEDENVRTRAKEMLIHIANARKRYFPAENNLSVKDSDLEKNNRNKKPL